MSSKYQQLLAHLGEINNIHMAEAVLDWDQQTQMPLGGAEARAAQLATLSRIGHVMLTSDETARLLEDANREIDGADYDSDAASMVRVVRQDYDEATKLPSDFVGEWTRLTSIGQDIWAKARANNDFKAFEPTLTQIVEMVLQRAEYLGYEEHPYDALLGEYERGMTTAQVKHIFDQHRPELVELIAAIGEVEDRVNDDLLHQPFDIDKQREFGLWASQAFGFDYERGRLDPTVHPFETNFSRNDVRITTKYYPDYFSSALFSTLHETGHGLYEQGIGESLEGTLIGTGTSLAVHESQSRLWENIVGRSREFWQSALPRVKDTFPAQFGSIDLDTLYQAVNRVKRSFIRIEADEATYNLHIMLRFELETDMLLGKIKVADLPKEWNNRFKSYLGLTPPNDADGVLQDVHWSAGLIGYFSTYALGNLLSAQYYNRALQAHPTIPDEIADGKFDTLHNWLTENIYQHGRKFTSDELTQRVTGESIQARDYMHYLKTKYSDIYGL